MSPAAGNAVNQHTHDFNLGDDEKLITDADPPHRPRRACAHGKILNERHHVAVVPVHCGLAAGDVIARPRPLVPVVPVEHSARTALGVQTARGGARTG